MLNKLKPTIAIIDSGIGGISILKDILNKYHSGNYIYFADNLYLPYGKHTKSFVKNRVEKIIKMLKDNYLADIIIVACNTASSCINNDLNFVYKLTFNGNYTFLTTSLTKKNINNPSIADKTLAKIIEKNIFNKTKMERIIKQHIKKYHLDNLKNLVLACTHYELVYDIFKKFLPNTNVLKNSSNLINKLNFNPQTDQTNIILLQSKASKSYQDNFYKLIRS